MTVGWVGALFAAGVGAAVALVFVSRCSDGPIGPLAGGPFRTGELVTGPEPDWAFAAGVETVELQLVDPPNSRTTHLVVYQGRPYIPCGIVAVGPFVFLGQAFWKRWPSAALRDPRAILRIGGRLYERRAVRVDDVDLHRRLGALVAEKYRMKLPEALDPEEVWFFRLERR